MFPLQNGSCIKTHIIGHRGCAGLLPENSISACRQAIEMGLDGFEIDVQLSADEEPILYHNLCINHHYSRLNGSWLKYKNIALKSLTLSELKLYDIGQIRPWSLYRLKRRRQKATDKEGIPTLSQVFELIQAKAPAGFQLWIELKTSPLLPHLSAVPELLVEKVLQVVHQFDFQNRIILLSFDWRCLVHALERYPSIACAFLTTEHRRDDTVYRSRNKLSPWLAGYDLKDFKGSIPHMIRKMGGQYWVPFYKDLSRDDIHKAQALGLKVYTWTVNRSSTMKTLKGWGIDGLITDYPDIALEFRNSLLDCH